MAFLTYKVAEKQQQMQFNENLYLGADSSNHLQLPFDDLGARQFQIIYNGSVWMLRNLNPNSPTRLNGVPIKEAYLNYNDTIQAANIDFNFVKDIVPVCQGPLSSRNKQWSDQLTLLPEFAKSSFPVLITGQSGTGKESIAEAIHQNSQYSHGPLVKVNCSALSETLIESELFGHKRGAFTGAIEDRKGAFEAARGGTLFLDEIGDLPQSLQSKLLRALENGEIKAVGSDQTIKIQCRIVAATHQKLESMVEDGLFRMDLYYRLNVVQISPPSLKERIEDFEPILFKLAKDNKVCFSQPAIELMKRYEWPGNIRELKNVILKASVIFKNHRIQAEDLERLGIKWQTKRSPIPLDSSSILSDTAIPATKTNVVKDIEKELIVTRLIANEGNQRLTASELGIPKSTLHDRLRHYGIDSKQLKKKFRVSSLTSCSKLA